MKKKGFSLIELLAIIIILAVIALIATPIVLDVVEKAKEQSRVESANGLIDAAKLYLSEALIKGDKPTTGNVLDKLENRISGRMPESGNVQISDKRGVAIAVKYDGYCYVKGFEEPTAYRDDYNKNCTIVERTEDTCYEIETVQSYSIVENVCTVKIEELLNINATDEQITTLCNNEQLDNGIEFRNLFDKYTSTELTELGIIENVVATKKCESCFIYSNNSTGITITGYKCTVGNNNKLPEITDIIIPTKINGSYVTSIGSSAFYNLNLTSLDITRATGLETIGNNAFANNNFRGNLNLSATSLTNINSSAFTNNNFTSVQFPNSLVNMGSSAFANNQIRGELDLSNTQLTQIPNNAFDENSINSLKLADKIETIGSYAFDNNQISNLVLSKNIKTISSGAFFRNQISGELNLSDFGSLTTIGSNAFYDNSISKLTLPVEIERIESGAFESNNLSGDYDLTYLTKINYLAGFEYNNITGVSIPNTVTTIGSEAFRNNDIEELTLPTNLETIDSYAFADNMLKTINFNNKIKTIGSFAFNANQLTDIEIPTSVTDIKHAAFNDNNLIESDAFVYKRNSDGSIDNTILVSYGGANKNIIIPANIVTIGERAIYNTYQNYAIKSVDFSNATNLTTIGSYAFYYNDLTTLTLPENLITIESNAFDNNDLTTLVINDNLTTIKSYAFQNNYLNNINFNNKLAFIGNFAFFSNSLTEIELPSSLTTIEYAAFNRNNLKDEYAFIYKRNSDGSIDNSLLVSYGGATKNVVIPTNIVTIDQYAFYNDSISTVNFSNATNLATINSYAFYSNSIKNIILPENLKTIGNQVFAYNNLESITLNNKLNTIGNYAFAYNNLTSVTIPTSIQSIGSNALYKYNRSGYTPSNANLKTISNKTGKEFNWTSIVGSNESQTFATGTINNIYGAVNVTN